MAWSKYPFSLAQFRYRAPAGQCEHEYPASFLGGSISRFLKSFSFSSLFLIFSLAKCLMTSSIFSRFCARKKRGVPRCKSVIIRRAEVGKSPESHQINFTGNGCQSPVKPFINVNPYLSDRKCDFENRVPVEGKVPAFPRLKLAKKEC